MIGIEKIKDKIISDAEARAKQIQQDAETEASKIMAEGKAKSQEKETALNKVMDQESAQARKIMLSMAELAMRNELLATKQELIEEVFAAAIDRLEKMTPQRYEELVKAMLLASVEDGDEEVLLSEAGRSKLSPDFLAKVNQELTATGKKGELKLAQEVPDIDGGFIIRKEGIEINNSFAALVNVYRDELEAEVAAVLF